MRVSLLLAAACLLSLSAGTSTEGTHVILTGPGGEHRFRVEVVDTPETRARGLMYRSELDRDAGMLFVFEPAAEVAFWMRNTYIPLDLLFVDRSGRVIRIHHDAQPLDETLIHSRGRVTHVLEINGGLAAELGIATGDRMRIQLPE